MTEPRRVVAFALALVFLAITTVTWADVTGPGTTGGEPTTTVPDPATTVPDPTTTVPDPTAIVPAPEPAPMPASTTEVPEAPPFEDAARDLGERDAGDGKAAKAPKVEKAPAASAGPPDKSWKAAKKAAKAECKRRFTGRERGQCISAAARAHKNPKARGRR